MRTNSFAIGGLDSYIAKRDVVKHKVGGAMICVLAGAVLARER